MSNPVILGAKLQMKRSSLSTVEGKITDLLAKRSELEGAIEGIGSEDDLALIEGQLNENETELTAAEGEKSVLEREIAELETQLEATRNKEPQNQSRSQEPGGKGNMSKDYLKELRSAINAFIRSKGKVEQRDVEGFKTVDGGILIPEELLAPEKEVADTVNLKNYVKVVPTKRGSGKYPIIKKSGAKMVTVAELAANPELATPTIDDVDFSIETYRGYVPISQEAIDDADYDIVGLIDEDIQDQEQNTINAAVATVLKTATAKTVAGLDALIALFNTGFKTAYNVKVYASQSLFNELDLLKYADGRYVLQEDVTVASGKRIKGKEIVVLDDEIIGEDPGDLVAFVGDAKAFAKFFDRKQVSVEWVDHNIYGKMLAAVVRFDVVKGDENAGYYVTYEPEVLPSTVSVTGVTLSPSTASAVAGAAGTQQFTATVAPSNATNKAVTFTVKDGDGEAVSGLTVSNTGLVSWTNAVEDGAYTVTVTTADGNKTATATLTLTEAEG